MAINEQIVTGRKYRRCIDAANKLWQRISFWNKASDTEFDDGKTAETKLGAINGISSSTTSDAQDVAASIGYVNQLNSNLVTSDNVQFRFATDGEGNYGYLGADDSFIPFKSGANIEDTVLKQGRDNLAVSFPLKSGTYILSAAGCTSGYYGNLDPVVSNSSGITVTTLESSNGYAPGGRSAYANAVLSIGIYLVVSSTDNETLTVGFTGKNGGYRQPGMAVLVKIS